MKLGVIGCGTMGYALIKGFTESGVLAKDHILCCETNEVTVSGLQAMGYTVADVKEAISCDAVLFSVKPYQFKNVYDAIRTFIRKDTLIISIMAGFTMNQLEGYFDGCPIVMLMPNTAVSVKKGMTAIVYGEKITNDHKEFIEKLASAVGNYEVIDESLHEASMGMSGSGIAYAYMYLESMADAGIRLGMKPEQALKFAANSAIGACEMVLQTGQHPAKLRQDVCSPRGTTIEGILKLEEMGFRSAIQQAVKATVDKSKGNLR
ncbi:MAG: pyrroline-5-carboxylate reductase [Erysipelotrichaceae bacterium]|nr:pyrroline-5-carboxylate reductase [Erysipelotrichaceae bacterium]